MKRDSKRDREKDCEINMERCQRSNTQNLDKSHFQSLKRCQLCKTEELNINTNRERHKYYESFLKQRTENE